jgi:hypothetical protein
MTKRANDTLRTLWAQGLIDTLGASHLIKFYDGTQPASTSASISGPTLLATLTADGTPSVSVTAGVLTFDAANYSQTNSSHVNGTPTWMSLQTSGGTRVYELSTADGLTFTGTIQENVDIARGAWTWTAPDA